MAVGQRTLAQLMDEIASLGLKVVFPVGKNGKVKKNKKDCVIVLRNYYIEEKYDGCVPQALRLMMEVDTPMLADRYADKHKVVQDAIWSEDDWWFQEKIDGCRMWIIYVKGEGLFCYSRGVSLEDYCPIDYTDHIYFGNANESLLGDSFNSFILDTEVICQNPRISTILNKKGVVTETQLQAVAALLAIGAEESLRIQETQDCALGFRSFDAPYYDGEWLIEGKREIVLEDRDTVQCYIAERMKEQGFNVEALTYLKKSEFKKKFLDAIFSNRGEGVVAKHRRGLYRPVEARTKNTWVKIKRSVMGSLLSTPYNDTLDAFVTGYSLGEKGNEGLIGSLFFSIRLGDEKDWTLHEIARISGFSKEQRQVWTEIVEGLPVLNQSLYGRVAEIDGQAVSARVRRLSHSRIIVWRDDKVSQNCYLSEKFLNSMIM